MVYGKKVPRVNRRRDMVPGALAIGVTVMVALACLTPYVIKIPEANINLITQAQTTLWNGWLMILGYFFGTTNSQNAAVNKVADNAAPN